VNHSVGSECDRMSIIPKVHPYVLTQSNSIKCVPNLHMFAGVTQPPLCGSFRIQNLEPEAPRVQVIKNA